MLGHDVRAVEVSRPLAELVAELTTLAPDLVFNLAEGNRGRAREALYPAIYEQLGLRYTGSSASVLALCLDKVLAKRVVEAAGVRVPAGALVRGSSSPDIALPAIVKPNFEGSSIGITAASVVTTRSELATAIASTLGLFPHGVIVEEYIAGDDIAVAWVAGIGLLPAVRYVLPPGHTIYDRALKVEARAVPIEVVDLATDSAARAFAALGVTGFGRADFRVTPSGELVFLEMNPLPSLAWPHNELYAAAARLGKTPEHVVAAIVANTNDWPVERSRLH